MHHLEEKISCCRTARQVFSLRERSFSYFGLTHVRRNLQYCVHSASIVVYKNSNVSAGHQAEMVLLMPGQMCCSWQMVKFQLFCLALLHKTSQSICPVQTHGDGQLARPLHPNDPGQPYTPPPAMHRQHQNQGDRKQLAFMRDLGFCEVPEAGPPLLVALACTPIGRNMKPHLDTSENGNLCGCCAAAQPGVLLFNSSISFLSGSAFSNIFVNQQEIHGAFPTGSTDWNHAQQGVSITGSSNRLLSSTAANQECTFPNAVLLLSILRQRISARTST